jgi:hypothetical protein
MSCTCRNHDGTLSQTCFGCKEKVETIAEYNKEFTMHQLQQIKNIVREALSVSVALDKVWIDGFLKGFQHGQEN